MNIKGAEDSVVSLIIHFCLQISHEFNDFSRKWGIFEHLQSQLLLRVLVLTVVPAL